MRLCNLVEQDMTEAMNLVWGGRGSQSILVLQQERNLATADNNLIAAEAAYAKDRAGLYQTLASTLQHYGINLNDAATGAVSATPNVPGLTPATNQNATPASAPSSR